MIKSKRGYIGLASKDVKVGDKIFVLAGESYPYVLRATDDENDSTFRLVCPAYIHGWMDEGSNHPERPELMFRTISLV